MTEGQPKRASVTVRTIDGDPPTVVVTGEIDLSTVGQVDSALQRLLQTEPLRIAFDLGGVSFMDSSGLAALISAAQRVPQVLIRNPSPSARRIIELTGLTSVLQFG